MAKGAESPWMRSLPTFCRIAESRSPRGSSGGEERESFNPQSSTAPQAKRKRFSRTESPPDSRVKSAARPPPLPGGNATDDRMHDSSCTADQSRRSGRSSSGQCYSPKEPTTTRCTRRSRPPAIARNLDRYKRRGSPGPLAVPIPGGNATEDRMHGSGYSAV